MIDPDIREKLEAQKRALPDMSKAKPRPTTGHIPEYGSGQPWAESAQPASGHHPAVDAVLRFFAYEHLPPHLQEISRPFCKLAHEVADRASNAETTVALRKLLEAKDAAIRAAL